MSISRLKSIVEKVLNRPVDRLTNRQHTTPPLARSAGGYANDTTPPSSEDSPSDLRLLSSELEKERALRLSLERELRDCKAMAQIAEKDSSKEVGDLKAQLSQQVALRTKISDALVKSQVRLTQAMDASRLGLVDWDLERGQLYQSNFHHVFGDKELNSEEHIKSLKRLIHPADYLDVREQINACIDGNKQDYQIQYRVRSEDEWIWLEECGKVVDVDQHGRALRMLGTRRNIQSEVARDEQVRLAKSVVDHTSEGVFVLDQNRRFLSVNPAYEKIIGISSDLLVGREIESLNDTPKRSDLYTEIFKEVDAKDLWQGELMEKRHHGDYFPQWTQINAIRDEKDSIKYYAGMVSDLSIREAADKKLNYLLNYDDLTKLANRSQFKDQLHRALVRFKDDGTPFALVTLDVDRFKQFNDSFGHDSSDELLREIARRLSAKVQKADILARIGGNEFACVVTCSPTFDVEKFARRLFDTVTQNHYEVAGQEVVLSCSVGVAQVPEHTNDIETLLQYAALAVQKAKFNGGDQILLFDDSLKSFSRQRLETEQALRKAIQRKELEVYYQPKFNVAESKITSCEALIRWNHPTMGTISPENFVNVAEESSLISELGAYVMREACQQTKAWQEQGYGALGVAVNLSSRQVSEESLHGLIEDILSETGFQSSSLELELTESLIMENLKGAQNTLNRLKSLGLKISIDDFGTGYSSLSYLKELPVDSLKVDRSFIEEMERSSAQQAIVKAIIVLGHALGLKVVVEGVENTAQFELLSELGCDYIQGYVVAKPLNAREMEALLSKQKLS